MSAKVWFRCASILLLLFAAGHTFGFLAFHGETAGGAAVWQSMQHVVVANGHLTYGGFYLGFGLFVTLFLLFAAWLSWLLGSMAQRSAHDARLVAWALSLTQCVSLGLSVRYFFAPPAVLSALAAICFALGAWKVKDASVIG